MTAGGDGRRCHREVGGVGADAGDDVAATVAAGAATALATAGRRGGSVLST